jgi:hypothetical protein
MARCATVSCQNEAAERISYRLRGGNTTDHDDVCTPCADDYSRRPVLVDFTRAPLTAGEDIRYHTLTREDVGRAVLDLWGRKWSVQSFMGRILPGDVGKRVYRVPMDDRSGYILQVENDSQRDTRLARWARGKGE